MHLFSFLRPVQDSLRLVGPGASHRTIVGRTFGRPDRPTSRNDPTIAIWSEHTAEGWAPPTDITLRDLEVTGSVRLWGMDAGADYADLRRSSRTLDHTANAQKAAPTRILIENVTFHATGSIPLYIGPGVTEVTVRRCRFEGRSTSTAIYLDAESARCVIEDCDFTLSTRREVIAVDGSAHNRIVNNRFRLGYHGAVRLYRNCGERGVVRHQTPSWNVITGNRFRFAYLWRPRPVVEGSRGGARGYCTEDAGFPFGSSIDDGDHPEHNTIDSD